MNGGKPHVIDLGTPARGLAFIKRIETLDRYPGSTIFLTEKSQEKIAEQQFEVVAVGLWGRCEDPDECERPHYVGLENELLHPYDVRVGDWVLCRKRSWMATPEPGVYCVKVEDILGKFVVT